MVDAPNDNAFKGRLDKGRQIRVGFFMDKALGPTA